MFNPVRKINNLSHTGADIPILALSPIVFWAIVVWELFVGSVVPLPYVHSLGVVVCVLLNIVWVLLSYCHRPLDRDHLIEVLIGVFWSVVWFFVIVLIVSLFISSGSKSIVHSDTANQ